MTKGQGRPSLFPPFSPLTPSALLCLPLPNPAGCSDTSAERRDGCLCGSKQHQRGSKLAHRVQRLLNRSLCDTWSAGRLRKAAGAAVGYQRLWMRVRMRLLVRSCSFRGAHPPIPSRTLLVRGCRTSVRPRFSQEHSITSLPARHLGRAAQRADVAQSRALASNMSSPLCQQSGQWCAATSLHGSISAG